MSAFTETGKLLMVTDKKKNFIVPLFKSLGILGEQIISLICWVRVHLECPIAVGVQTAGRKLSSIHRHVAFLKHKLSPKALLWVETAVLTYFLRIQLKESTLISSKWWLMMKTICKSEQWQYYLLIWLFCPHLFFLCLQVCLYASVSMLPSPWLTLVSWA